MISLGENVKCEREGGRISRENVKGAQLMRDSPNKLFTPLACHLGVLLAARVSGLPRRASPLGAIPPP